MYNSKITAYANYLPPKAVTNDDLSLMVETNDEWIRTRTGISERHVSTGETAADLCVKAAEKLIKKSGLDTLSVDMIIVATITPDYSTPNTACLVQAAIGADNAFAFDISAACSGFVYAMSVADKYIKSGAAKKILVFGSEVLSAITDWTDRSSCVLFGDGAGAALVEASESCAGVIAEDIHSIGADGLKLTGNSLYIDTPFFENDKQRQPYLKMDGKAIFTFATKRVPQSVNAVLEKAGVSKDDIAYVVPHQANYRIVEAMAKKLDMPLEKFFMNIENCGNTSSASIPIALADMDEKGLLKEGSKIVLTGFGGGLTWGSLLIEL
ncbi:MAG: ketoacyl-ACP synthase III [Firmicutes bacterium]|nr:ketoacyl-ACP synthase III [Bacillota bacterium]